MGLKDAFLLVTLIYIVPLSFMMGIWGIVILIRNKYYTPRYQKMYVQQFKEAYDRFIDNNIGEIVACRLNNQIPVVPYDFNKKRIFFLFRDDKYVRRVFELVIYELADDEYKFKNTRFYDCVTEVVLQSKGE